MQKITLLDEATINKIAAGEVIDRPFSVVKELLENSIDAASTNIKIEVENAGKKSIKITDNGTGISKEDLALAVTRHATSKIKKLEDIYQTHSMGFRGEALASICHVARLTITSKIADNEAYEIVADPDASAPRVAAHLVGTTILVQDLFQRVPVRRKYLKSNATEFSYIYDIVQKYALIYPEIDFVLLSDGKEVINTTGITDTKILISLFYGKDLNDKLIKVESFAGDLVCKGYITKPDFTYPVRSKQIVSINKRLIKNSLLNKVIQRTYENLIPARRFPLVVINIDLPTEIYDVNIHPKKEDLKFLNSSFVFDALAKILKVSLESNNQTINFTEELSQKKGFDFSNSFEKENTEIHQNTLNTLFSFDKEEFKGGERVSLFDANKESSQQDINYFQIFNTYLVIKAADAVWILDQHAVHERILFEKINKNRDKPKEKQILLTGEIIELDATMYDLFLENGQLLKDMGFDVEDFGQNQIIVRQIPIEFSGVSIKDFVVLFLEGLKNQENITMREFEADKYHQLACKAAIKAGKNMHTSEVKQLVADFVAEKVNYTCPHGRPLCVKFGKKDLEKLFLRI